MTQPSTETNNLPHFSNITPQYIAKALDECLHQGRQLVKTITQQPQFTWDNLIAPLEEQDDHLDRLWSSVSHLNAVSNTPALRTLYQDYVVKITVYATEISQNKDLFLAYQAIKDSPEFVDLSQAQQKTINDALRDFTLSGVALAPDAKKHFKQIQQKLSELGTKFENNLMDATDHWHYHTEDQDELSGLPPHTIQAAHQKAVEKNLPGWCLGLDAPTYTAVLSYADNRHLRQQLYTAFTTRASDQGPDAGLFDNTDLMDQILALRHREAQLLNFDNFAALSIVSKMADSTDKVIAFLTDLTQKAKPVAKKELQDLQAFAKSNGFDAGLQAWDIAYFSEKLQQQTCGLSQEMLRPYFPITQVIAGLFKLIEKIYGMHVKTRSVDTWDPHVTFYDVVDNQGQLRGSFYMDLYARANKRGGAWVGESRARRFMLNGKLQHPVGYLNCNFTPPIDHQPTCITHDDVVTLFHEFGHCMHHIMTQVDIPSVSGMRGVEWDAVELPSQFMENFCWQRPVIDLIAHHVDSSEKLPSHLFEKLQKSRQFQSGLALLRQLELSLFDFLLHRDYQADQPKSIQAVLDQIRDEVAVIKPPAFNRFQNSFNHIFGGGYAAGYYSYKWAEVLSADAFSYFEEQGILNREAGDAFLHHILEKGGSDTAMHLFVAFRGREPRIDALLKQCGI